MIRRRPGADSNTPASAANMAGTGWRRFSKPAPFSSNLLQRLNRLNKEMTDEQTHYDLPGRSRGSPRHPGTRRGLRALCRSPRCERSDGPLHGRHALRRVHECQGLDAFTGTPLARGARSGVRRPEPVHRDHALPWTDDDPNACGRSRHRRNLLHAPSPHDRWWNAKTDDCGSPVFGPVREDPRQMAVCGAAALCRLAGGASTIIIIDLTNGMGSTLADAVPGSRR